MPQGNEKIKAIAYEITDPPQRLQIKTELTCTPVYGGSVALHMKDLNGKTRNQITLTVDEWLYLFKGTGVCQIGHISQK